MWQTILIDSYSPFWQWPTKWWCKRLQITIDSMNGSSGQSTCQPIIESIRKNPTTYATATCDPWRIQRPTDFASGYMFASATPAEEPNQIMDPPKPTA